MTKVIGIDGSRAFIKKRTGIEEYSYQVIKHLRDKLGEDHKCPSNRRVVLYLRAKQEVDFGLPDNWKVKKFWAPRFWTQVRLSLEMLFHPVNILFIPAHTVPIIHPENTIVTIHGLEYEVFPETYTAWEKFYMRWSIRHSCKWANKIVAVSENTKRDLIRMYGVEAEKINIIYEGYGQQLSENMQSTIEVKNPYLLFIGRVESRKNSAGVVKAFEILKEKYKVPHKLVLAGKPGHGFAKIKNQIENSKYKKDIILPGFITEDRKWELLKEATVFLFPTFYEGFGIPVLEAQSVGVPVVAGNNSSIPEVTGCHSGLDPESSRKNLENILDSRFRGNDKCSALLVDPHDAEQIADATYKLISDKNLRDDIIKKGYENVKRFSWEKCANQIAILLNG